MKKYLKYLMNCSCEYESHIKNVFRLSSRHLQPFQPVNLLDVGCGDGSRTLRLAQHFMIPADHTYGLDSDHQHVIHCRQLFNAVLTDIESGQLPYRDQMFDLVVCNQVFEHLKNYHSVFEDIIRVTKSGGYIMIGIPNLAHLINRLFLLFGIQPMCIDLHSSHVRGFTHKAFEHTLKSTPGITYIDCEGSELIYPLPLLLAKPLSKMFVGLCAYVCYLVRKE
jgi:ubiquinone/menaquinone biosynthesis C-methylase UbiE